MTSTAINSQLRFSLEKATEIAGEGEPSREEYEFARQGVEQ
jgi:hypothetical protein